MLGKVYLIVNSVVGWVISEIQSSRFLFCKQGSCLFFFFHILLKVERKFPDLDLKMDRHISAFFDGSIENHFWKWFHNNKTDIDFHFFHMIFFVLVIKNGNIVKQQVIYFKANNLVSIYTIHLSINTCKRRPNNFWKKTFKKLKSCLYLNL